MKSKWGFNVTDENDPVIIPMTFKNKEQESEDNKQDKSKETSMLGAVIIAVLSFLFTALIITPFGIKNVPGLVIALVWLAVTVLFAWIASKI